MKNGGKENEVRGTVVIGLKNTAFFFFLNKAIQVGRVGPGPDSGTAKFESTRPSFNTLVQLVLFHF